jgi:hypothetical protein
MVMKAEFYRGPHDGLILTIKQIEANYSMGHQKLTNAAIQHGLVKYDHAEPTLA